MPLPKLKNSQISRRHSFRPRLQERFRTRRRLKAQTLTAMIPNITTLMALCCGMTAIRFALLEKWQLAAASVLLAAILDALDGRLARLLNSSSRFGAELDSFSDFLNFGIAPALIIYVRSMHHWGELGWAISLLFTICTVLRLARFNVTSVQLDQPVWMLSFFTGVPAPLGGFLCLFPIILSFACPSVEVFQTSWFNAFCMIGSACLMVSRIPTFSLKKVVIAPIYVMPFLLILFITIGMLYSYPWETLAVIGILYLMTLPFSLRSFRRHKRNTQEELVEIVDS